jgi:hypothetical protein
VLTGLIAYSLLPAEFTLAELQDVEAIQCYRAALALWQADGVQVMGVLRDVERRAWEATYRLARVSAGDVADDIACSVDEAQDALDSLLQHRLVMYIDGDYVAVGRARG